MKRHISRYGDRRLGIALGLLLLTAGCGDRSGGGQPPNQSQLQQEKISIMSDPHVPDSIKQHLGEQQDANQAASRGYTAAQHQKRAGNK